MFGWGFARYLSCHHRAVSFDLSTCVSDCGQIVTITCMIGSRHRDTSLCPLDIPQQTSLQLCDMYCLVARFADYCFAPV